MDRFLYNVAFGVGVVDATSDIVRSANETLARMHGTSVEDICASPLISLYAPADRERIKLLYDTADRTGHVVFEADRVRKDGSVFPAEMHITSVRGETDEVLYRIVTIQDITSRRQIEIDRDRSRRLEYPSPPLDCVAEGMWKIACGECLRDTWVMLAELEKERWRSYATTVVEGWVARVTGSLH